MTDQGRRALARRTPIRLITREDEATALVLAQDILGPHGLFIADASKHEPIMDHAGRFACTCGHVCMVPKGYPAESYFDHIGDPE